jgi:hypothetical protein
VNHFVTRNCHVPDCSDEFTPNQSPRRTGLTVCDRSDQDTIAPDAWTINETASLAPINPDGSAFGLPDEIERLASSNDVGRFAHTEFISALMHDQGLNCARCRVRSIPCRPGLSLRNDHGRDKHCSERKCRSPVSAGLNPSWHLRFYQPTAVSQLCFLNATGKPRRRSDWQWHSRCGGKLEVPLKEIPHLRDGHLFSRREGG